MADTFSIRTDPEIDAALTYLGVTDEARNRSAIIKEAIVMAARVKRDIEEADNTPEPTLTRVPVSYTDGSTGYILRIPDLGGSR